MAIPGDRQKWCLYSTGQKCGWQCDKHKAEKPVIKWQKVCVGCRMPEGTHHEHCLLGRNAELEAENKRLREALQRIGADLEFIRQDLDDGDEESASKITVAVLKEHAEYFTE